MLDRYNRAICLRGREQMSEAQKTERNPETDVVTPLCRTADGQGWVWKLEPGKRVVLDQYDQWQPEDGDDRTGAIHEGRIVLSPKELARRAEGAARLKARLGNVPFYRERAEKQGDVYWENLYAGRINS